MKLLGRGLDRNRIREVWSDAGDDFFLRHTPRQVAELTVAIAEHETDLPLVQIIERKGQVSEEGATEICIYTKDRPRLFAATVGTLSQLGLSVHDATFHTAESGWCLNSFIVLDEDTGKAPGRRQSDRERLIQAIGDALAAKQLTSAPIRRRLPRQLKQLPTPTEVTLTANADSDTYELTIIASDRPGLLASIGLIFAEL
ncbi:MAG: [protein-PII] uridylyltransferase, partial [Gammaproteobacteria bacterium]